MKEKNFQQDENENEQQHEQRKNTTYCSADGQKCNGICRKVNSEKNFCTCKFQFDK